MERKSVAERALEWVGTATLFALMSIVVVDVAGRNLFNRPLPWGTEVLEVLLAAMVFALYPLLALRSRHITVDLIELRPALQAVQRLVAAVVGAVLFAVVAYCCARQAIRSASYGDASAMLGIPTSWVLWAMAGLSAVTALAFLAAAAFGRRGVAAAHAGTVPQGS
jgi:TRAP-type C4-dicarboxylate transport system permease small subunit